MILSGTLDVNKSKNRYTITDMMPCMLLDPLYVHTLQLHTYKCTQLSSDSMRVKVACE